jgi:hypothetical protein
MSASQTRTYRISHDLAEAMDILAKEIGFASGGALLKSLIRYAVLTGAKHSVSLPWSLLTPEQQDKLDAILLEWRKQGKGMTAAEAAKWDWRKDV